MPAFTASQASVTNNSKVVQINSGESIANVNSGDFLVLAGFIVEINRAYLGAEGKGYFELVKQWPNSNQANQECIVIPTTGEFKKAVEALSNANVLVNDNFKALQDWQTKTGTVTFSNQDGTTSTVKTLKQIENEAQAQLDEYHPYPWAMRKVEFEARRAANNEKFAASGFVHFGKHYTQNNNLGMAVGEGLWTRTEGSNVQPSTFFLGRGSNSVDSKSKKQFPHINIAGVISNLHYLSHEFNHNAVSVKLPPPEDGTRTYDGTTGDSVKHATAAIAFASETESNEVVTDRVDMWGFEALLREINDNDPFVYKGGLIQSLASDINGVVTVSDTTRPITYFAWYKGDSSSRGKGVNWQTATEQQRIAIASDPENNIYFDDATGKFYQWSIRGRSFAGAGNGDWINIDSENLYLGFGTNARVKVQGLSEDDGDFDKETVNQFRGYESTGNKYPFVGLFTQHENEIGKAVDGQCFFLVCGTVNRKNRGAYHPSFNEYGARAWNRRDGGGNTPFHLYNNFGGTSGEMSRLTAFQNGRESGNDGVGYASNSGLVSSTGAPKSGSPDLGLCDAIASSGVGGICRDMRYSAWGLKAEDFAKVDLNIKSGAYRGLEKGTFSKVVSTTHSSSLLSEYIWLSSEERQPIAERDSVFLLENGVWTKYLIRNASKVDGRWDIRLYGTHNRTAGEVAVIEYKDGSTIAGSYLQKDVIGDPEQIALVEDLQEGWVGSWIPEIPSGSALEFKFTKPITSEVTRFFTDNSGVSWSSSGITEDFVKNSYIASLPSGRVGIYAYETKAVSVVKALNSPLYGDSLGAVSLLSSSSAENSRGRLFCHSLINKVPTNSLYDPSLNQNYTSSPALLELSVLGGKLNPTYAPTHNILKLGTPNNDSPGFKALKYNVVENSKAYVQYAYTELSYDATAGDWGDDSKVHIADNQTTMPDENGNTVLVGTARCVESIGWIKNDK